MGIYPMNFAFLENELRLLRRPFERKNNLWC